MTTGNLRRLAAAIGLGVFAFGAQAVADQPSSSGAPSYRAPAKWNSFRRPSAPLKSAVDGQAGSVAFGASIQSAVAYQDDLSEPQDPLPPPANEAPADERRAETAPADDALQMPIAPPAVDSTSQGVGIVGCDGGCDDLGCASGGCNGAACGVAAPRPIAPWFASSSLLFWNLECGTNNILVTDDRPVPLVRVNDLAPGSGVGFDTHFGRYFGCGQYGLDFGYMLWDPDAETRVLANGGWGYRVTIPALTGISINRGSGATTVYDDYDMNAAQIRVVRDLRIQGFEANLVSFGLMGARRLGSCNPSPLFGHGHCGKGFYGGATGPLARSASPRLRVQTSHGFRWFQLEDELQISGDVDGMPGYQPPDLHYLLNTENNLFGYQFGSRLAYCLGRRTLLSIGGKIGVYGNDAFVSHRVTTNTVLAYTNTQGAGAGDVCTEDSDVSVAGLGELDFGIGYRLNNRWTVTGGYRLLTACGVVTAIGQMPTEYVTRASAGAIRADDCLFLHGAHVGINCNW